MTIITAAAQAHVSAGPGLLGWVAIAIAALVVRVLVVLVSTTGRCRKCRGRKITTSRDGTRARTCPRCKGAGRRPRVGSALIHRMIWDGEIGDKILAGQRDRNRQRREDRAGR